MKTKAISTMSKLLEIMSSTSPKPAGLRFEVGLKINTLSFVVENSDAYRLELRGYLIDNDHCHQICAFGIGR